MSPLTIAVIMIAGLFVCVFMGIHIGYSLGLLSFLGIVLITGNINTGISILSTTAYEAIRDYAFAVAPLFMLMGTFMSNSTIANDLFAWCGAVLRKIPGGVAVATVFANAIFAAVTGVSIASAAIFGKVAIPEMNKQHYNAEFAAGTVAGSSVLGMLIPPSMMFILYGMLAEVSIGKMFVAGIIPGIILAVMFSIMIIIIARVKPSAIFVEGMTHKDIAAKKLSESGGKSFGQLCIGVIPTFVLIFLVLGGIWLGWFTPTEAAGIGAMGALIIAIILGMPFSGVKKALLETASGTSSVLFLIICATMYSRMLTLSGLVAWLNRFIIGLNLSRYVVLMLFMILVLALGCVLDSSSILLLTVPLMYPIMMSMGFNPIWFGIILVLFVHMGLLTPPFGICVFAVKAATDFPLKLEAIFRRSLPFLGVMLLHAIICIIFPQLSLLLV